MAKYNVSVTRIGELRDYIEVEANSKREAEDLAWDLTSADVPGNFEINDSFTDVYLIAEKAVA